MCYLERIGLRELRQNASTYIARVARGETVEVTQRGRLVARIVPVGSDTWEELILRGDIVPAESTGDLLGLTPVDYPYRLSDDLTSMRDDDER